MKKFALAALLATPFAACTTPVVNQRAAVLDYLYPADQAVAPPADVRLTLPLRVGIAFAPADPAARARARGPVWGQEFEYVQTFDETEKQRLVQRVIAAFEDTPDVASIQSIPASYIEPGGGFANVDRLRSLLGIDLIVLLSYDQTQIQDVNKKSLTYVTLVASYFVEGNENATHTFVDASVFDIPSRALLFNSAGSSRIRRASTAVGSPAMLREDGTKGFEKATDEMIGNLKTALAAFREQVKSGSVRGAGTPNISVAGGAQGAGAFGWQELLILLAIAAACGLHRTVALRSERSEHAR